MSEPGAARPPSAAPRRRASPGTRPNGGRTLPDAGAALLEVRFQGASLAPWVQELYDRWGASVRLQVCRPIGGGRRRLLRLFEVDAVPERIDEVRQYLVAHFGPAHAAVARIAPHRLMVWTETASPRLCSAVFAAGAICTVCPQIHPVQGNNGERWGILLPQGADARLPLDATARPGRAPAAVVRIGRYVEDGPLTPRQELVLDEAVRLGFFAFPRRAGLKELAREVGISRPTAMEILRRAIGKLAAQHRANPLEAASEPSR